MRCEVLGLASRSLQPQGASALKAMVFTRPPGWWFDYRRRLPLAAIPHTWGKRAAPGVADPLARQCTGCGVQLVVYTSRALAVLAQLLHGQEGRQQYLDSIQPERQCRACRRKRLGVPEDPY